MENLEYKTFTLQPYLSSPQFTSEEASLLLALRTRTVRGIRSDFGQMYPDKQCPMPGCEEQDSISHTLDCGVIRGELEDVEDFAGVGLVDVFSSKIEEQKKVVGVYGTVLDMRERILDFLTSKDNDDDNDNDEDV